jgi:anti-anti-sigma regulatory factor
MEVCMLTVSAERIGKMVVVACKGRIVQSEDVFKLRDIVMAHASACVITLDLDGVRALGGGALGMFAFLAKWARDHGVRFTLYGPSNPIVAGLASNGLKLNVEIAGFRKMMGILAECEAQPGSQAETQWGEAPRLAA